MKPQLVMPIHNAHAAVAAFQRFRARTTPAVTFAAPKAPKPSFLKRLFLLLKTEH